MFAPTLVSYTHTNIIRKSYKEVPESDVISLTLMEYYDGSHDSAKESSRLRLTSFVIRKFYTCELQLITLLRVARVQNMRYSFHVQLTTRGRRTRV